MFHGASFSGHERNHLFLNSQSKQFYDLAGASGLDHPGDSRSFAFLDYDRDGWQDIALVNTNAPFFQLYRNQIGDWKSSDSRGQIVALRFIGGNHTASPSEHFSNRDGYGAKVTLSIGNLTIQREHRSGEGKAAQNSTTMIIGIGKRAKADSIVVQWPSGVVQETHDVPVGTLVTVYENPSQQLDGQAFVLQPYEALTKVPTSEKLTTIETSRKRLQLAHSTTKSKLVMYTTMATWCAACKRELPQLKQLRDRFDSSLVAMFGVPIDENDSAKKLEKYIAEYQPAYELLADLTPDAVAKAQGIVKEALLLDGLPATIVTDGDGYILKTMWGVPSASDIHQWIENLPRL